MKKLVQSLAVGICISLPCTFLTMVLLQNGSPAVVRNLEALTIVPFFLTYFTAMLVRWDQGAGLLVFAAFVFLQWYLVSFAVFYLCHLSVSLASRFLPRNDEQTHVSHDATPRRQSRGDL